MGYRRKRSEPINRRITTPDAVFSILERYAMWILSHFRVSEGGAIKFRFDVPIIRNRQSTFSWYKRLCCSDVKLLILLASEASPDNPPLGTTSPNEFIALEISPVRPIFHASIRGIILGIRRSVFVVDRTLGGVLRLGFLRPLKRPQGGLKQASRPTIEYGSATWPRVSSLQRYRLHLESLSSVRLSPPSGN
jgi:hypothetical protein